VTLFIGLCGVLLLAALAVLCWPLRHARLTVGVLAVAISLAAATLYWQVGHTNWQKDQATAAANAVAAKDVAAGMARLEERLRTTPNDAEAAVDLAEALFAQDERQLTGRAGQLIEQALLHAPNNPKALWYGAVTALSVGKLPVARERLQRMLAQNPPDHIRSIVERQIQNLDEQLAQQPKSTAPAIPPAAGRSITVQVAVAAEVAKLVAPGTALFILARNPAAGGPPLAVVRKTAAELPLTITLTDSNAMIAGRGISSVPRVQVVARLSKSGNPQQQPGDWYGESQVDFGKQEQVALRLTIDKTVTGN
jgi:cytochrome c-type biogenesis protein CcmH